MHAFLTNDWCNLNWSNWVPFDGGDFKGLHAGAGLYRIRVADRPVLAYVGQTGHDLHQRLGDLRRNVLAEAMPFNDPHTAAPSLWAWRDARIQIRVLGSTKRRPSVQKTGNRVLATLEVSS
jgi:hypothetical protein